MSKAAIFSLGLCVGCIVSGLMTLALAESIEGTTASDRVMRGLLHFIARLFVIFMLVFLVLGALV